MRITFDGVLVNVLFGFFFLLHERAAVGRQYHDCIVPFHVEY